MKVETMKKRPLKIYLFFCSKCIDTEEMRRFCIERNDDELKPVSLPCSGKVDLLYLLKAFETGADGAVIVTCKIGECSYLEGNLRARKRAEAVDTLLQEIGLDEGRIQVIQSNGEGAAPIHREIGDFITRIGNRISGTGAAGTSASRP